MIYGHIPQWMLEENPAFARAVARYYSIEHGQRKAAAKGQLAHVHAAFGMVERYPPALTPVLWFLGRMSQAMREKDEGFFGRLWGAMQLSLKKLGEKKPPMIECIFEAFRYLRLRDGPGSPLPDKAEVKNKAALIAALCMEGLTAKIPRFLWHGRGLTGEQFERVNALRLDFMDERSHHWSRRLAEAGLGDLPQKRRS